MSNLFKLVYSSKCVNDFSDESLTRLMIRARVHNFDAGITGYLIHHRGRFIQYLEGSQGKVESLFTSILSDNRHTNIKLLCSSEIQNRAFDEWSMACRNIHEDKLADFKTAYDLLQGIIRPSMMGLLCEKTIAIYDRFLTESQLQT